MVREHGSSNWSLSELRKCLLKELNVMEAGNSIGSQEGRLQPTATFMTNTKQTRVKPSARSQMHSVPEPAKRACAFCKGPHSRADCTEVTDHDGRINIVKRDHLCFNCLRCHKISDCKSKSKCRNCSRRHHTSLCKGTTRKSHEKPQTQATSSKSHNAKEPSTSLQLHSSLAQSHRHVLLKTVMAPLSSGKTCLDAKSLLDEGAQRSFITTKLADKLELVPSGRETQCISGFGENNKKIRELPTTAVYLQTEQEIIPIDVLIVPEIAVTLKTYAHNL